MQNIVVDMCEKFHNDRFRSDRALVLWKSDNNKKKHNNKNNVGSTRGPVSRSNNAGEPLRTSHKFSIITVQKLTIYSA